MKRKLILFITLIFFILSVLGCEGPDYQDVTQTTNPYLKKDETWISISGRAVDTGIDSFTLDYGEGVIVVEMDGWGWYTDDFQKIEDHKVRVYGRIDDDLYETTTIEASSVYDENLGFRCRYT